MKLPLDLAKAFNKVNELIETKSPKMEAERDRLRDLISDATRPIQVPVECWKKSQEIVVSVPTSTSFDPILFLATYGASNLFKKAEFLTFIYANNPKYKMIAPEPEIMELETLKRVRNIGATASKNPKHVIRVVNSKKELVCTIEGYRTVELFEGEKENVIKNLVAALEDCYPAVANALKSKAIAPKKAKAEKAAKPVKSKAKAEKAK